MGYTRPARAPDEHGLRGAAAAIQRRGGHCAVAAAGALQPEALTSVHALDDSGGCAGRQLVTLVQASPGAALADVCDDDPVGSAPIPTSWTWPC